MRQLIWFFFFGKQLLGMCWIRDRDNANIVRIKPELIWVDTTEEEHYEYCESGKQKFIQMIDYKKITKADNIDDSHYLLMKWKWYSLTLRSIPSRQSQRIFSVEERPQNIQKKKYQSNLHKSDKTTITATLIEIHNCITKYKKPSFTEVSDETK